MCVISLELLNGCFFGPRPLKLCLCLPLRNFQFGLGLENERVGHFVRFHAKPVALRLCAAHQLRLQQNKMIGVRMSAWDVER